MAHIEFYYADQWKQFDIYSETSQHPNFPSENTQHRDKHREWRSRYGAGTHWGYFYIGPGFSNNKIDFNEGVGALVATITTGIYNVDTLCTEIKTQLEAVGTGTYTIEYIESGSNANKFKITKSAGALLLLWNTGVNKANSIATTIGYDDSANDTGSLSYTADYIRIHSKENILIDLGTNKNIYGFFVAGHNLQAGATVRIKGSTSGFSGWGIDQVMTVQDNYLYYRWTSAQAYRYWEFFIQDMDNPDLYIAAGTIYLCTQPFTPARNFQADHSFSNIDPSHLKISEDGQLTSNQFTHFKTKNYNFRAKNESADFKSMFDEVGTSKSLFIIEDPGDLPGSLYYARLTGMEFSAIVYANDYWTISIGTEEIR